MAPGHSPASCRTCLERLRQQWPAFRDRVELLLARRASRRIAGTRIVATILKDLFTTALDWPRSCIRARLESPTILVVTAKQMTGLVVEARTPHSLPWDTPVIMAALHRLRTS